MTEAIRHYWTMVRTSLWLVPLLMSAAAIAAAFALLEVQVPASSHSPVQRFLYAGNADSARNLLGALLTGMITMFSLVLSITMVVLTLAAAQLGSRLIRSFMDDRATQAVLGLFLATVLYLLIVLRTVDDQSASELPQVAVTVGTMLTALCLFVLLLFIDRLARSLVFDNVAHRVSMELADTSDWLRDGQQPDAGGAATQAEPGPGDVAGGFEHAAPVVLGTDGYVQSVGYATLVQVAERADAVLRLDVRPGHWINADSPCVAVSPAAACDEPMRRAIRQAFIIGSERTPAQDLEYGLQRLVEIALRALSPGINDEFTGMAAIDNLAASVARIFKQPAAARSLRDPGGRVRVVRRVSDPRDIVDAAFDQIRQSGAHAPAIAIRLLDALGGLAPAARSARQRAAVLEQIDAVLASAQPDEMVAKDANAVRERHRRARANLA